MERFEKILAIDPMARGVAFVVLSGTNHVIEWAMVTRFHQVSDRLERVFHHFNPSYLVLEVPLDPRRSKRAERVQAMALGIADRLGVADIGVSRAAIREHFGIRNKYRIAESLVKLYPELERSAPPFRKPWMNEDPRVNIFDALSAAVVAKERLKKGE